jgi:hypothetical protein
MGKYPPLEVINGEVLVEVERSEYWLLYYGEWKRQGENGEARPELTYCVSIGVLTADMAEDIAKKYEINYRIQSETLGTLSARFHGFSPDPGSFACPLGVGYPLEGFFGPFWDMHSRELLSESFVDDCVKAMLRFEDDGESGTNNDVIKSLHQIIRHADKVRTLKQGDSITGGIENPYMPKTKDMAKEFITELEAVMLALLKATYMSETDIVAELKTIIETKMGADMRVAMRTAMEAYQEATKRANFRAFVEVSLETMGMSKERAAWLDVDIEVEVEASIGKLEEAIRKVLQMFTASVKWIMEAKIGEIMEAIRKATDVLKRMMTELEAMAEVARNETNVPKEKMAQLEVIIEACRNLADMSEIEIELTVGFAAIMEAFQKTTDVSTVDITAELKAIMETIRMEALQQASEVPEIENSHSPEKKMTKSRSRALRLRRKRNKRKFGVESSGDRHTEAVLGSKLMAVLRSADMSEKEIELMAKLEAKIMPGTGVQTEEFQKAADVGKKIKAILEAKWAAFRKATDVPEEIAAAEMKKLPAAKRQKQMIPRLETVTNAETAKSDTQPTTKKKPKRESGDGFGRSKYEAPVQSIIDIHMPDVLAGKADPLSRREIASKLKKEWEQFKGVEVGSIEKRVGETSAWKNYDEDLNQAWREAGLGATFTNRKKGGKHHNRKGMDPHVDVQ